jgi:hypothetical protein
LLFQRDRGLENEVSGLINNLVSCRFKFFEQWRMLDDHLSSRLDSKNSDDLVKIWEQEGRYYDEILSEELGDFV